DFHVTGVQTCALPISCGDRILFTKNSKKLGVKNGTLATIQRIEQHEKGFYLQVKTDDGQLVRVDPAKYEHLQHGYAVSVHKSQRSEERRVGKGGKTRG